MKNITWLLLSMTLLLAPTVSLAQLTSTRKFTMGFVAFPYDRTREAANFTWNFIANHGEHVTFHFDNGVPWYESAMGTPFPAALESDIVTYNLMAGSRVRILNVNPISITRDGLALYRNEKTDQPLDDFWKAQAFNSTYVKTAFVNYCSRMIDKLKPSIFSYAIESNTLYENVRVKDPKKWSDYVELMNHVYVQLKTKYPSLKIVNSIQVETYYNDPFSQDLALRQIMYFSDLVAISTYPYRHHTSPMNIPSNYFSKIFDYGSGKGVMISETGWPSSPITSPSPYNIYSDENNQSLFVLRIINEAAARNAVALNWFLVRDYDTFWNRDLQFLPGAISSREWKDAGLVEDSTGVNKLGLLWWDAKRKTYPYTP